MIKKLWQRLTSKKMPVFTPAMAADLSSMPILERCRTIYETIDLNPFLQYSQYDGQGKSISVVHQNIDACIADIAQLVDQLDNTQHVRPAERPYQHKPKPVNRFFIDKEGCYLTSVYDKLVELRTVVLDLCKLIESTKETDYYSYNLRHLSALLFTLYDLGTGLVEISLNIKQRS